MDHSSKPVVELSPEQPAQEAMRTIHRALLETVRSNEQGVRRDLDPEFLHDFRVAVRRTRAALTQIKGVFPAGRAAHFRRQFSWLQRVTGPQRDLDVYLLKLDDYRAALPGAVADDLRPLEELLRRRQKVEHRRLVRSLGTKRYARLLAEWESFLADEEGPQPPPALAEEPIGRVAARRILTRHAKVLAKGRAIGPDSPDKKFHRLRIDCKKLRYLLEFFRGLYAPHELAGLVKTLKALQDNLGDFNDLSVQQRAMRGFAEELQAAGASPATLTALDRLIAVLARRQGEERRHFGDLFGRFDRPGVRQRLAGLVTSNGPRNSAPLS